MTPPISKIDVDDGIPQVDLLHHGVAASSSPNVIACIPAWKDHEDTNVSNNGNDTEIIYASHLILNVARIQTIPLLGTTPSVVLGNNNYNNNNYNHNSVGPGTSRTNKKGETIWNVYKTLRTCTHVEAEVATAAANVSTLTAKRVITCVTRLQQHYVNHQPPQPQQQQQQKPKRRNNDNVLLVCGFSDGTMTSWFRDSNGNGTWNERVLYNNQTQPSTSSSFGRSITALDGYYNINTTPTSSSTTTDNGDVTSIQISIVSCSSGGAHYFCFHVNNNNNNNNNNMSNDVVEESNNNNNNSVIMDQQCRLIHTPSNAVKFQILTSTTINNDNPSKEEEEEHVKCNRLGIFLVGTAAPRHNKIHVLFVDRPFSHQQQQQRNGHETNIPTYSGSLSGHEDWITCFDWATAATAATTAAATAAAIPQQQSQSQSQPSTTASPISDDQSDRVGGMYYLATASQDGKIRLWKWVTTKSTTAKTAVLKGPGDKEEVNSVPSLDAIQDSKDDDEDDDEDDDGEEILEGEARLEIVHGNDHSLTTSVFLEALLIGHEEMVTSVAWHPNPQQLYGQDLILISSSMDRTIVIWSSTTTTTTSTTGSGVAGEGVWAPVARVGSAGGILGGSVGSSLLGFINVKIEPVYGRWIMGHAYGGALHFFSHETSAHFSPQTDGSSNDEEKDGECTNNVLTMTMSMPIEERAALIQWRAQPCITGHFGEVTDLCWDADAGDYLITVSNDQTCRVWAPLTRPDEDVWIEIGRPQVHGYNLSAVTSLSTSSHKHLLVTGADEKEMRVFDGTLSFERMLRLSSGTGLFETSNDVAGDEQGTTSDRVERAFIPALGLSNKASAIHAAEEDLAGASTASTLLPLERDLGSTSLWPELRKLFGHNSELARLTCTLSSRTLLSVQYPTPNYHQVLVASSTKARDVETANIRIWDVINNRCVQVLKGGHRSTVTAISFSPDGTYFASSGKDRRLCLWKRSSNMVDSSEPFFLAAAVESSHKRIVWSVHFCPSEPSIVASGSRDGTIKLWKLADESVDGRTETTVTNYSKFIPTMGGLTGGKAEAVTSLAFAPVGARSTGILSVGFENGMIQLWRVPLVLNSATDVDQQPYLVTAFDAQICHIGIVTKLEWRPTHSIDMTKPALMVLASCSSDNGCRIFKVRIPPNSEEDNHTDDVP